MPFPEGATQKEKMAIVQEGLDMLEPQSGDVRHGDVRHQTNFWLQTREEFEEKERQHKANSPNGGTVK